MSRSFWFVMVLAILGATAALTGCNGSRGTAAAQEPVVARPATAVEVAPVRVADVADALELVGAIKPKFEATVRSEFVGKLSDVYITEWVKVKKGQPLAKLDTREDDTKISQGQAAIAQANADLVSAQAAAQRTERDFKRISQLKTEEIVSEQALDEARQQRDSTAAQVAAAQARLRVAEEALTQARLRQTKSLLVAPMDGVVADRKANVGQFVDNMGQGEPLFRIVDNAILDVTLTVPSTALSKVCIGQEVLFTTDFLPGKAFTAEVTTINPAADPATRAVSIVAEVKNTSGELRDGLFVKARIVVGQRKGVMQIPRAALLPGAGEAGATELFVIQDGKAVRRAVQTGHEAADTIEIASGLKPGEQVVTRGAFLLQDGDPVKVVSGEGTAVAEKTSPTPAHPATAEVAHTGGA